MKTLLLILALCFAAPALAGEDPRALMSLPDAGAQPVQAGAVCYAYTSCPNGGTIWCKTWSGPGGICSWYTQPGQYVHCEGHDAYGTWTTFTFFCP